LTSRNDSRLAKRNECAERFFTSTTWPVMPSFFAITR